MDEGITDSKLYELAIAAKQNIQERREDINKYYTSLFTAVIPITALIDKVPVKDYMPLAKYGTVNVLLCFLSIVILILALSWILTLKRIYHNIEGFDQFLITIEKQYNKKFIIFTKEHLSKVNAPGKVTRNEMVIPYMFLIVFSLIFVYATGMLITR